MTLPPGCTPCFHIARRIAHHAYRVVRHPVHHIAHHPGRWAVAVCCAGTLGGGTLPVPPAGSPLAVYAPSASQAWPEMPNYSGGGFGGGNFGGGGYSGGVSGYGAPTIPISVYGAQQSPELLGVQQNYTPGTTSLSAHATSIPEPATAALLLLPLIGLAAVRRARA